MDLRLSKITAFISEYIPNSYTFFRFDFLLQTLYTLGPLLQLHLNQYTWGGQPPRLEGAWFRGMREIILHAAQPELLQDDEEQRWPGSSLNAQNQRVIWQNLEQLLHSLQINDYKGQAEPLPVLCTKHRNCKFCHNHPPLHKHEIWRSLFINSRGRRVQAWIVIAKCPARNCQAHYFPDRISIQRREEGTRTTRRDILECDASVLHISKAGLWIDRFIARMQERLTYSHMSWAGFADYFNDLYRADNAGNDLLSSDTSKWLDSVS